MGKPGERNLLCKQDYSAGNDKIIVGYDNVKD